METKIIFNENVAVVAVKGDINNATSQKLDEVLEEVLKKTFNVELDFSEVDYISSAGLRVLVALYQETEDNSGSIKIMNPNAEVKEVFEITGLDEVFNIV